MTKNKLIPVCEPLYLGKEEKYVRDAVHSRWISSAGEYIGKFEEKFSGYCGTKFGVATTSGTAALHLALLAIGIKEEDEVVIPDFTMAAVLFAVLYCQAKPVFVDVERDTWNIDLSKIEEKITRKTKAIVPVHTYGHPAGMGHIMKLARKYNLFVIEDAAEAHGAQYLGKKCGSIGDIGCFSFYSNKIITTGEGGMVVTSDKKLADRCRYYKNLCFSLSGKRNYIHNDLGFNYRMTNVQAALGLAQLENINKFISLRRRHAKQYDALLKNIAGIKLPVEKEYAKNAYWMYGIVIEPRKFGKSRDELMRLLAKKGIETRVFFRPLHSQKVLEKFGMKDRGNYLVAESLSKNGLYLPSGSGLKTEEIEYICAQVRSIAQIK
jgi:perosamine synthetase